MSRMTGKDDRGRYYTVEEKILITKIADEPVNPTTTWIVHNENRRYGSPIDKLGKLEDLMEKYEIESLEELEELIKDYDDMAKSIVEMGLGIKVEIKDKSQ